MDSAQRQSAARARLRKHLITLRGAGFELTEKFDELNKVASRLQAAIVDVETVLDELARADGK